MLAVPVVECDSCNNVSTLLVVVVFVNVADVAAIFPATVNPVNVPTLVNEELLTVLPKVVLFNTSVPSILKVPVESKSIFVDVIVKDSFMTLLSNVFNINFVSS